MNRGKQKDGNEMSVERNREDVFPAVTLYVMPHLWDTAGNGVNHCSMPAKEKHLGVSLSLSISSSLPYFTCTTADSACAHRLCSRTVPPYIIIFKGIVHAKIKILSSFTHLYVVPNLYDFFFIVLVLFHANSSHGGWHFRVSKRLQRKVKVSKTWSLWLMRLNSSLVNSYNRLMWGTGQNMSLKNFLCSEC